MLSEPQVAEAVVRHFSEPQFTGFYTRREVEIQMGSSRRFADIVLYTNVSFPQMVVIVECKREGIQGIDQLHSYLSASATEFGIFANTDNPNSWYYVKNCGSNQFEKITRADLEDRLEELRPLPDDQRRRDLMNDTQIRARTALFELKEAALIVLLKARQAGEGHIHFDEIRKRLSIPRVDEPAAHTNSLIRGVLCHLQADELVQFETNSGWQVTEEAASLLNGT